MNFDRVLVTGSAGVIGRELLGMLTRRGVQVLSVDRLPLVWDAPEAVEHHRMDLATGDLQFVWDFQPQIIFHLAASFERAEETPDFWDPNWADNVIVSHRLAEGARRSRGVEVLVFASSYLIYDPSEYLTPSPRPAPVFLSERSRIAPRNLCGAAKLYTEKEFAFAQEMLDGPSRVAMARIFRVYGRGSRDVISRWVRAAIAHDPLTVYQRENIFDYVFASDVASALLAIAESDNAAGIINVGSGTPYRIEDVLELISVSFAGNSVSHAEISGGDLYEASCADVSLLRKLTAWEPGIGLDEGIKLLIEHESRS